MQMDSEQKKNACFINRLEMSLILSQLDTIAFCSLSNHQGQNNEPRITTRQQNDANECVKLYFI